MRKRTYKKVKSLLICSIMVVSTMVGIPSSVVNANESSSHAGYIEIDDYSKSDGESAYTDRYLYNYWGTEEGKLVDSYEKMTYDSSTNTLTMDGCNNSKIILRVDGMGKDFKINLKGNNAIGSVEGMITGFSIIGNGSLSVNVNRTEHTAFRLSGQTPPPNEVDESFEYVNGSLHIGPEATVTTYCGDKESGGNNIEIIWATTDKIDGVLSYEGDISESLDYQSNENKGETQYSYYNETVNVFHAIDPDYLYKDDTGNYYIEYVDEDYSDAYLQLEEHENKWYVLRTITYGNTVSGLKKCTDNIPDSLKSGEDKIGVYSYINYNDEDLLYGYTKNSKLYVIMPKKSLCWNVDKENENSDIYCIAEISDSKVELSSYISPWLVVSGSITDVESVKNYTQAAEYMDNNGYVKKGYTQPTMYEYIVMNDVLKFTPKKTTPSGGDNGSGNGGNTNGSNGVKNNDNNNSNNAGDNTAQSGDKQTTPADTTTTATTTNVEKDAVIKDTTTGASYKVTEVTTSGTPEVEYTPSAESKDSEVVIPSKVNLNGVEAEVTSIADGAFKKSKVTAITIPDTVESIGKSAFEGSAKLKTLTIKGSKLTTIGDSAFKGCSSLTKVTLPKSVKTVGKNAFTNCKKLKTITVKNKKIKFVKNSLKGVPKTATVKLPKMTSKEKKAFKKMLKSAGFKGKVK